MKFKIGDKLRLCSESELHILLEKYGTFHFGFNTDMYKDLGKLVTVVDVYSRYDSTGISFQVDGVKSCYTWDARFCFPVFRAKLKRKKLLHNT